jgi:anti-sigma B factor antagonist
MSDIHTTSGGDNPPLGTVEIGHHEAGLAVVTMRGEHDLDTQPVLARALALAAAHSNVLIDLTECSFIDSSVIKEFIKTSNRVSAKGEKVTLVIPPEQKAVERISGLIGLAHTFEIHETKGAALASLEAALAEQQSRP